MIYVSPAGWCLKTLAICLNSIVFLYLYQHVTLCSLSLHSSFSITSQSSISPPWAASILYTTFSKHQEGFHTKKNDIFIYMIVLHMYHIQLQEGAQQTHWRTSAYFWAPNHVRTYMNTCTRACTLMCTCLCICARIHPHSHAHLDTLTQLQIVSYDIVNIFI